MQQVAMREADWATLQKPSAFARMEGGLANLLSSPLIAQVPRRSYEDWVRAFAAMSSSDRTSHGDAPANSLYP